MLRQRNVHIPGLTAEASHPSPLETLRQKDHMFLGLLVLWSDFRSNMGKSVRLYLSAKLKES